MSLTKHKRKLLAAKEAQGLEFALDKTDIVGLVSRAWLESFARVETNKKAIAHRGWNPLNYNCLLHPEIASSKPRPRINETNQQNDGQEISLDPKTIETTQEPGESITTILPPVEVSLKKGFSGQLIEKLCESRRLEDLRMSSSGSTIEERHNQRMQSANQAIADGKRITAGRFVAGGNFVLGQDLLQMREDKRLQNVERNCATNEKNPRIPETQSDCQFNQRTWTSDRTAKCS